ncbi:protein phosphatase 2C domain-containing protein [Succinimonas sp.]|uniref:PP2C family serine/threonine-protein phosphatase n=1 Tax=Succinimonas sp. TaxID=1936151 RepID=UPI003863BD98
MTEENFKEDSETVLSPGDTPVSEAASPQNNPQMENSADKLSGGEAGAERVPGDEGRSASADNAAPVENPGTVTPESFGEVVEVIHTAAGNVVTVGRKLSREMGLLLGSGLLTEEAKQQCTKICLDNASKYKSAVPETDIDKSYLDYKEEYVTIKLPVSVSKEHYFWVTYKSDATEDRIIVKHIFRLSRNDSVHPEKPSVSATDPAHVQPDSGKVAGTEPPAAVPAPEESSKPQEISHASFAHELDRLQAPQDSCCTQEPAPASGCAAQAVTDRNGEGQTSVLKTIDPPRNYSENEAAAPSENAAAPVGEPDSVRFKTGTAAKPESDQESNLESPQPINWPRVDDDHKSEAVNDLPETVVKPDPVQTAPKPRPNPRDLWKDIRTNTDIPYYKPDTATGFCAANNGKVKIFGASRRGRSHAHVGAPRDDDFQIKTDDVTGWTYLVVADGAGSAKYSRMGAERACEVVAERLPDLVKNEKFQEALIRLESNPGFGEAELEQLRKSAYYVLPKAAHEAFKSLNELVPTTKEKSELRDFATTLLCVITRNIHDRQLVISFAIGDGAIAVYDAGNSANTHLMNTPDSGEFAGQTRFLTMKSIFANSQEIMARIRIQCVPDYTAVMLMTDGVSDAKFETESLLEDKARWDDFWQDLTVNGSDDSPPLNLDSSAEELSKQLLEWLNFWVVGNHDDRTIVVMCKGGAE